MNWISSFELLLIHEKVIAETGGNKGVLNYGNLKAAVSRPFAAFGDQEVFPSLTAKIAAQIHAISSYHPFVDGNKRTALVAADVCLRLNGYHLADSDDLESFFWSIARREESYGMGKESACCNIRNIVKEYNGIGNNMESGLKEIKKLNRSGIGEENYVDLYGKQDLWQQHEYN